VVIVHGSAKICVHDMAALRHVMDAISPAVTSTCPPPSGAVEGSVTAVADAALCTICRATDCHYNGLNQACSAIRKRLPGSLVRRLRSLHSAAAEVRHASPQGHAEFLEQLRGAVSSLRAGPTDPSADTSTDANTDGSKDASGQNTPIAYRLGSDSDPDTGPNASADASIDCATLSADAGGQPEEQPEEQPEGDPARPTDVEASDTIDNFSTEIQEIKDVEVSDIIANFKANMPEIIAAAAAAAEAAAAKALGLSDAQPPVQVLKPGTDTIADNVQEKIPDENKECMDKDCMPQDFILITSKSKKKRSKHKVRFT